jgi:23S rRNA (guanosine2251-2'-O)-methyltransferase
MKDRPLTFRDQRKDPQKYKAHILAHRFPLALLLDGVTDIRNFAGMFRLADAGRLQAIYGYKMEDLRTHKRMAKISRHTQDLVPYHSLPNLEAVAALQSQFEFVVLDITEKSIPYTEFTPAGPTLLIIGNEQKGVSQELLDLAGQAIHIPMHGFNFSMNVTVSTGIATFKLLEHLAKA